MRRRRRHKNRKIIREYDDSTDQRHRLNEARPPELVDVLREYNQLNPDDAIPSVQQLSMILMSARKKIRQAIIEVI